MLLLVDLNQDERIFISCCSFAAVAQFLLLLKVNFKSQMFEQQQAAESVCSLLDV